MQNSLLCHSCSPGNHNRINNNHLAWQRFSPSGINVELFWRNLGEICKHTCKLLLFGTCWFIVSPFLALAITLSSRPLSRELATVPLSLSEAEFICHPWYHVHLQHTSDICSRNSEHFKLVGGLTLLSHIFKK